MDGVSPLLPVIGLSGRAPEHPTPLVGREPELRWLSEALIHRRARLVTLTGPPGVGKSRLAQAAVEHVRESFADGARVVDLASAQTAEDALGRVAQAFGLRDRVTGHLARRLRRHLETRELLLVLDTCEHVLGVASTVAELVAACPRLVVLATSRAPLHLRVEQRMPVQPLAVPEATSGGAAAELTTVPSMALFVERAREAGAGFELDDGNAAIVADVCRRLDGLPLAIELAAARTAILPLTALASQLASPGGAMGVLSGGPRDAPERHRSLARAVAWSYALLDAAQRALLGRLAVFVGPFAIRAAADAAGTVDWEELFLSLVDQGLVQPIRGDGRPRFRLFDAVREYALSVMSPQQRVDARRRHAARSLRLVEAAAPALTGEDQARASEVLGAELDDALRATAWATAQGDGVTALRLVAALGYFCVVSGRAAESHKLFTAALLQFPAAPGRLRAPAAYAASLVAMARGDVWSAASLTGEAVELARESGQVFLAQHAAVGRALALLRLGLPEEARAVAGRAPFPSAAAGDPYVCALAARALGELAAAGQDHARAEELYLDAVERFRLAGDLWSVAAVQAVWLARALARQGQPGRAAEQIAEGLAAARRFSQPYTIVNAVETLVLELAWPPSARLLHVVAGYEALRARLDLPFTVPNGTGRLARLRDALERALGVGEVAMAWDAEWGITAEELADQALVLLGRRGGDGETGGGDVVRSSPPVPARGVLTSREGEVMRLVAEGLSTQLIARALGTSEATVKRRVAAAMDKLGAKNRARAAVLARRVGQL